MRVRALGSSVDAQRANSARTRVQEVRYLVRDTGSHRHRSDFVSDLVVVLEP